MKKQITPVFALLLVATGLFAQKIPGSTTAEQALQKADKQFFIENKGQWPSDVLYLTRMGRLDVWITKYGVNYTFYKIEKNPHAKKADILLSKFDHDMEDATLLGHRVLMKLQNHNSRPQREGKQKQAGYYNYLIGNDPSKHASNVGLYKEAVVKNVYNGIDLRYYFDKGSLRYDFMVQPGADPSQIRFSLEGENKEYLKNGALCYTTRFGEVQMQDLYVYQQGNKKQVQAKFTQQNGVWQFQLSNYDKTQALIIDPLIYSTYIGGSAYEQGDDIALDLSGNAYITGYTSSSNYNITPGAFQTTISGSSDVFVTKLNNTGSALIYSTYIGGSNNDYAYAIAIDPSGNAYITGTTESTDFDITPGAFQSGFAGGFKDVFVTKLNSTGTALIYSTYVGGNGGDIAQDINIDASGNAFITGDTKSTDYDITPGVFQAANAGNSDVFVTKLNGTGTALLYSTYIGGSSNDYGIGIAIDASGNAYITGYTYSTNYDITPGAFQTAFGGVLDVVVTKLNSTGTALMYSTYIGGSGNDGGLDIAIDGYGNAYISGQTTSTNYDITSGAFQTTYRGGTYDAFVTKLNSTGTALIYSTYIGGSDYEEGSSIAVDGSGNAYITGWTVSTDYHITPGAFQTTNGGPNDVFVTKLYPTNIVLPIALLNFEVAANQSTVELFWSTAHEVNNDYFVVEKSKDGRVWEAVLRTPGAGNSNTTRHYRGKDSHPYKGTSYYRLKQVDLDGRFTYSSVRTVHFHSNAQFSISPNPSKGSFTIQSAKGGVFELLDATGKVLRSYTISSTQQTIHQSLPAGMYFVREKQSGAMQKLLVQ
jgi:uncharacterized protein (AIM24 family)